jgi:hypothetical protein
MATSRPFAFNEGSPIPGTQQIGDISIGIPTAGFASTGLEWWNGPDEDLGYVVCGPVPNETQQSQVPMKWDRTKVGPLCILSSDELTVTSKDPQLDGLINSSLAETRIFRKSMFTIVLDTLVNVGFIGLGKSVMDLTSYVGGTDGQSFGFSVTGDVIFSGNTISSGFPTWGGIGDKVEIAIDFDNSTIWIRVNGGNWNNSPSANPDGNIGGETCPISLTDVYPAVSVYNSGDDVTVTIAKDPGFTIPNGFKFLRNTGAVRFIRSAALTDESFVSLVNTNFNQVFISPQIAKTWLNANGMWTSYGELPQGMVLYLDAGLSASYPGSGTTWFDLSGNGNDGTFAGGSQFSAGSGGHIKFDGVDSAITFNNPVNIPIGNEPYTISVWFNSDEMPSDRGFVGWGGFGNVNQVNAWRLRNTGVSGFRHYWWGNDLDYTTPMNSGTWYNAVAAYENGSRKLYLNNVQVAEDFPTGHDVPYSTNLRIGVTADFLGEWFDGEIAQVIIYKRQATVAEINAIWNSGKYRFGY